MRHAPPLAACAACGLALLLAWLAPQPYAAPVPTGPFLPGYGSARDGPAAPPRGPCRPSSCCCP
jgi:hypothetical protein